MDNGSKKNRIKVKITNARKSGKKAVSDLTLSNEGYTWNKNRKENEWKEENLLSESHKDLAS